MLLKNALDRRVQSGLSANFVSALSSSSTERPAVSGARIRTTDNVSRPAAAMSVIVAPMPNASTSAGKDAVHTTPPSNRPPIPSQVDRPMARIGVGYCSEYHILYDGAEPEAANRNRQPHPIMAIGPDD